MRVAGIEIKAREVRIVVLDGTKGQYTHIDCEPRKLVLDNDHDAAMVRSFFNTMQAFVAEQHVSAVGVKARGTKGDHAGGPIGFKIEGLLQLLDGCEVSMVWPASIAATKRKHVLQMPPNLNKYQHSAFELAFHQLPDA